MTTAIIGVGNLGSALARHLVHGRERVVLAARDGAHSAALAQELGPLARFAPVRQAIEESDTVVLAMWLPAVTEVLSVTDNVDLLKGKVVVDPTNPIKLGDNGALMRSLPEGQSSGSVVAGLLPREAHYVKAFGSLGAQSLAASANRSPRRAVLFYATDDTQAAASVERLISAAGFDAVRAGSLKDAARIEGPDGDLSQGQLKGALLDIDEARAAVAGAPVA
ncbi:MAG TPA: NAD(P)-binding domain-containing protein [Solirubrobacteraceae bacterium]